MVKQWYLLRMFSNYGERRLANGWDRFVSLGYPSKFQEVTRLASLLQRGRSTEANQTLHDVWPSPGLVHYIYIFGGSYPLMEFCQVQKIALRPSFVFFYIGIVTARQSSRGRQPKFAAWYKEWNYRTFAEGATYIRLGSHHVGHRPTFLVIDCIEKLIQRRMWANAQLDGHLAEYRWRPLFNTAKFGWRPLLEWRAIRLTRCKTRWN